MLDAGKCLEIYDYCNKQYEKLARKDGHYNPSKHDRIVLNMAAKEYKMSEVNIERAYDLAARASVKSAGNSGIKGGAEQTLRKMLFNNLGLQIK